MQVSSLELSIYHAMLCTAWYCHEKSACPSVCFALGRPQYYQSSPRATSPNSRWNSTGVWKKWLFRALTDLYARFEAALTEYGSMCPCLVCTISQSVTRISITVSTICNPHMSILGRQGKTNRADHYISVSAYFRFFTVVLI